MISLYKVISSIWRNKEKEGLTNCINHFKRDVCKSFNFFNGEKRCINFWSDKVVTCGLKIPFNFEDKLL